LSVRGGWRPVRRVGGNRHAAALRFAAVSRTAGFFVVAYAFLVTMLGATIPTPLYPLFAERYSFGALMITVIFGVYSFGAIAGLLAFGELSDEIGRKPVLITGLALSALSAVLFVFAESLTPIFAARIASGLSAGIFTGTATATLVDLVPGDRRRLASLVAVVVTLGGLGLGTLIAGVLADHFGSPLELPFAVHLGLLAPALVGMLLVPESVQRRRFRLRLQRLGVPESVRTVFVLGAAAGFASFAVTGLLSAVAPAFLHDVLGHSSHTLAGVLLSVLLGGSIVGQLVIGRFSDRGALVIGCALLIVGLALLALALAVESLVVLIASCAVVGLGQGMALGAGLAAINQRAPVERRGETASSYFVVVYIGLSVPVIGAGLGAYAFGLRTAGIAFSVAVAALVLPVLARLARARELSLA
jgi:MFS family permease